MALTGRREEPPSVSHAQILLVDADVAQHAEAHRAEEVENLRQRAVQAVLLDVEAQHGRQVLGQVGRHHVEGEIYAGLADYYRPHRDAGENRSKRRRGKVRVALEYTNFPPQIILLLDADEAIRLGILRAAQHLRGIKRFFRVGRGLIPAITSRLVINYAESGRV